MELETESVGEDIIDQSDVDKNSDNLNEGNQSQSVSCYLLQAYFSGVTGKKLLRSMQSLKIVII